MTSRIKEMVAKDKINPPIFVSEQILYEVIGGSQAYGTNLNNSDIDIFGFCMPPVEMLFPHLTGKIQGFGMTPENFKQYQQHRIMDGNIEYDFGIYNIARFFNLCMQNNPNLLDVLFVSEDCIITETDISKKIRANRELFINQQCFHKFRGYSQSQLKRLRTGSTGKSPKRAKLIETYGYDSKYAMHMCRLGLEALQLLTTGTMNLRKDSDFLLDVRKGYFKTMDEIVTWQVNIDLQLQKALKTTKIPEYPLEGRIHKLLMKCIHDFYPALDNF